MSWVNVYGLRGRGMNVAFRVCVRERLWMEDVVDGRRGEDERSVEGRGSFPILGDSCICLLRD